MDKEKSYKPIKRWIYRKFNELEVSEDHFTNIIYLHYKNDENAQVLIGKNLGKVFYHDKFRKKLYMYVPLEEKDFQILLKDWIEDTYHAKVDYISHIHSDTTVLLRLPFELRKKYDR